MNKEQNIEKEALKINCQECLGICCTALYFSKMDGFYGNKKAGTKCIHLDIQHRCTIYQDLLKKHSKGCRIYECFGAGQLVTKKYPKNQQVNQEVCDVYLLMYPLHQILWYLLQAKQYGQKEVETMISKVQESIALPSKDLLKMDVNAILIEAKQVLKKACDTLTKTDQTKKQTYFQKDFSKQQLDEKDFSMTSMIGCNLEGSHLFHTNFLATDMRDVNIKNTDMSQCYFLTQGQINSAIGNQYTILPNDLTRPSTWQND